MKLGLVVNDVQTEETGYTTSRLALAAHDAGHEVWTIGVGDLAFSMVSRLVGYRTARPATHAVKWRQHHGAQEEIGQF